MSVYPKGVHTAGKSLPTPSLDLALNVDGNLHSVNLIKAMWLTHSDGRIDESRRRGGPGRTSDGMAGRSGTSQRKDKDFDNGQRTGISCRLGGTSPSPVVRSLSPPTASSLSSTCFLIIDHAPPLLSLRNP